MTETAIGQVIGYARVSTGHQSLDQQIDALTKAGAEPNRIYSDKLSGTKMNVERPGMATLLGYVREGDLIVVTSIDRLGRNIGEVMTTINTLADNGIAVRSLREGLDSSTPVGRAMFGVFASLAQLELEWQRERKDAARAARKARGLPIGRPKALDSDKAALAQRMRNSGEPVDVIAEATGVSRATVYRLLADGTSA